MNHDDENPRMKGPDPAAINEPGRVRNSDSIAASSEDPGGSPEGKKYAGYVSPTATRIGDEEDSDDKVERLRQLHEGRHRSDGEFSVREAEQYKKRTAEAICSSLPLTKREREDVLSVVMDIDFTRFGQQKAVPRVTLGIIVVIADERHRQSLDDPDLVMLSDEFREVCEKHDVSMSDLSTIKEKVREALETREVTVGPNRPIRDPALPAPTPPDNYPDEFWEAYSAEGWVSLAKTWEMQDGDLKEAIPDEYRKIVDNLRRWEPWKTDEEDDVETPAPEGSENSLDADIEEEANELADGMNENSE